MKIKLFTFPSPSSREILNIDIPDGATIIDICEIAKQADPSIDWLELVKTKMVKVNYRQYSNTEETKESHYGSIWNTPLNESDIVIVFTEKEAE